MHKQSSILFLHLKILIHQFSWFVFGVIRHCPQCLKYFLNIDSFGTVTFVYFFRNDLLSNFQSQIPASIGTNCINCRFRLWNAWTSVHALEAAYLITYDALILGPISAFSNELEF